MKKAVRVHFIASAIAAGLSLALYAYLYFFNVSDASGPFLKYGFSDSFYRKFLIFYYVVIPLAIVAIIMLIRGLWLWKKSK